MLPTAAPTPTDVNTTPVTILLLLLRRCAGPFAPASATATPATATPPLAAITDTAWFWAPASAMGKQPVMPHSSSADPAETSIAEPATTPIRAALEIAMPVGRSGSVPDLAASDVLPAGGGTYRGGASL